LRSSLTLAKPFDSMRDFACPSVKLFAPETGARIGRTVGSIHGRRVSVTVCRLRNGSVIIIATIAAIAR
jgi:hypothetical protein